jgi:hypothetical protein
MYTNVPVFPFLVFDLYPFAVARLGFLASRGKHSQTPPVRGIMNVTIITVVY